MIVAVIEFFIVHPLVTSAELSFVIYSHLRFPDLFYLKNVYNVDCSAVQTTEPKTYELNQSEISLFFVDK